MLDVNEGEWSKRDEETKRLPFALEEQQESSAKSLAGLAIRKARALIPNKISLLRAQEGEEQQKPAQSTHIKRYEDHETKTLPQTMEHLRRPRDAQASFSVRYVSVRQRNNVLATPF